MESLFRFMMTRPPLKPAGDGSDRARIDEDTDFQQALQTEAAARPLTSGSLSIPQAVAAAADKAIDKIGNSHKLVEATPSDLAQQLLSVSDWVKTSKKPMRNGDFVAKVSEVVGKDVVTLSEDATFKTLRAELSDRIVAAKCGSDANRRQLPRLLVLARTVAAIHAAANARDEAKPANEIVRAIFANTVVLPPKIFPLTKLVAVSPSDQSASAANDGAQSQPIIEEPQDHNESADDAPLSTVAINRAQRELRLLPQAALETRANERGTGRSRTFRSAGASALRARVPFMRRRPIHRRMTEMATPPILVRDRRALSEEVQETLHKAGVDLQRDDLHVALTMLQSMLQAANGRSPTAADARSSRLSGGLDTLQIGTTPLRWDKLPTLLDWKRSTDEEEEAEPEGLPGVPTTIGAFRPSGVGDLLVVRQTIRKYEMAEIAHIENVLPGEERRREHETRVRTETTFFTERETTAIEERDLESTERFEMAREVAETIETDLRAHVGLAASYKYGPGSSVSVEAELDASQVRTKAQTEAQTYAREVTARTASRITERALERREERFTRETFERNLHGLDGRYYEHPTAHVYQWLTKVFDAQIFNYGKRLLFDIVVPEPASLVIQAAQQAVADGPVPKEPVELSEPYSSLNENNYAEIGARYGLSGLEPPLDETTTVTWPKAWASTGWENDQGAHAESEEVPLPPEYQLDQITVTATGGGWSGEDNNYYVEVVVGPYAFGFGWDSGPVQSLIVSGRQVGELSVGLYTFAVSDVSVTVQLRCRLTDRSREEWQLKTYASIQEAYDKALREVPAGAYGASAAGGAGHFGSQSRAEPNNRAP